MASIVPEIAASGTPVTPRRGESEDHLLRTELEHLAVELVRGRVDATAPEGLRGRLAAAEKIAEEKNGIGEIYPAPVVDVGGADALRLRPSTEKPVEREERVGNVDARIDVDVASMKRDHAFGLTLAGLEGAQVDRVAAGPSEAVGITSRRSRVDPASIAGEPARTTQVALVDDEIRHVTVVATEIENADSLKIEVRLTHELGILADERRIEGTTNLVTDVSPDDRVNRAYLAAPLVTSDRRPWPSAVVGDCRVPNPDLRPVLHGDRRRRVSGDDPVDDSPLGFLKRAGHTRRDLLVADDTRVANIREATEKRKPRRVAFDERASQRHGRASQRDERAVSNLSVGELCDRVIEDQDSSESGRPLDPAHSDESGDRALLRIQAKKTTLRPTLRSRRRKSCVARRRRAPRARFARWRTAAPSSRSRRRRA